MNKLLALALAATYSAAWAQTPTMNPMPDGSHDMYAGLGAVAAPRYEGAGRRKVSALPVLQFQWSNGFFISGMSAGMHMSHSLTHEYGPLLSLQLRRDDAGERPGVGEVATYAPNAFRILPRPPAPTPSGLAGMDPIATRLQAGGFFNYYLASDWRLTSSLLYGSGNRHNGALVDLGLQRLAAPVGQHQTLALSAGLTAANRNYNQAFFGVSQAEALRSGYAMYDAAGGLKDAHLGLRWNWALSPSWLLTTNLQGTHLLGSARNSPLVERPTNLTVSTAIAYRF
jgi:outer membrane scaffolding protein for murein synthesis (MipA/OmpV family)